MDETHYLKLAYIAETVLVINLAYIELKWRKELRKFKRTLSLPEWDALAKTTETTDTPHKVCESRKCTKCFTTNYLNKHEDNSTECIVKMADALFYDPNEDLSDCSQNTEIHTSNWTRFQLVMKSWRYADGIFSKHLMRIFHIIAKRSIDRTLAILSMVFATVVLILITLADNNIDPFNLLNKLNFYTHQEYWKFWLSYFLGASILMTGMFWSMWNMYLTDYACLGFSLIQAYQQRVRREVRQHIDLLSSLNINQNGAESPTAAKLSQRQQQQRKKRR